MKIGVLFNCQTVGLAASLRHLLPDHEIIHHRFADVGKSDETAHDAAVLLRRCDTVITTTTGVNLRDADPARLDAAGVTVMRIPHVVFGGFHPDSCYSPNPKSGIPGPTERFHSRIAACAFLAGLDIEDTLALYTRLPFARLGYFTHYAQQRAAMLEQWAAYSVDLAPWFARWEQSGCFMHSMNHPKIGVLHDVARMICEKLELQTRESGAPPEDNMANLASHPVYADLAEVLGVTPESHFRPQSAEGMQARLLDQPTFLARSFAAFAKSPRAAVRALDGVPNAMRALELVPL